MYKKTLVCLDGNKRNEAILPFIKELVGYTGSSILLLNVIPRPIVLPGLGNYYIEPSESPELTKQEEKTADYLEEIAENWRLQGLDVESILVQGSIKETIRTVITDRGINLVALTTHDHNPFKQLFFQDITEYIIKHSGIPVLVICPDHSPVLTGGLPQ